MNKSTTAATTGDRNKSIALGVVVTLFLLFALLTHMGNGKKGGGGIYEDQDLHTSHEELKGELSERKLYLKGLSKRLQRLETSARVASRTSVDENPVVASTNRKKSRKDPYAEDDSPPAANPVEPQEPPSSPQGITSAASPPSSQGDPFSFPPEPQRLGTLPNKLPDPSAWPGADWGPVESPVNWAASFGGGKQVPLFRRELKAIRDQQLYPLHPVPTLRGGEVLYAKNLDVFRAALAKISSSGSVDDDTYSPPSVLELSVHAKKKKTTDDDDGSGGDKTTTSRPCLQTFFRQYLGTKSTYTLATDLDFSSIDGYDRSDLFSKKVASPTRDPTSLCQEMKAVDVIVGRAGEGIAAQIDMLRYLFVNLLKPGGVYFLEDVDMNFLKGSSEAKQLGSKRMLLTDYIRDAITAQSSIDWGKPSNHGEYRSDAFVNNWVEDVSCARGVCAFTKKLTPFNRMKGELVHKMPRYDENAPIQLSDFGSQKPLGALHKHALVDNLADAQYGPIYRPILGGGTSSPLWVEEANKFKIMADAALTDKSMAIENGHQYHAMYAKLLAPWREALSATFPEYEAQFPASGKDVKGEVEKKLFAGRRDKNFKMMEVGIGCDMTNTPAGGLRLHRQYVPNVEYNGFEYQWHMCKKRLNQLPEYAEAIDYLEKQGHIAHGDQSKYEDLKNAIRLLARTGVDIFVDDGSHIHKMMIATYREMFLGAVKPGGLFIMEDVQTAWWPSHGGSKIAHEHREIFQDVARDLVISLNYPSWLDSKYESQSSDASLYRGEASILNWMEDFRCGREMCGFQKLVTPISRQQQ